MPRSPDLTPELMEKMFAKMRTGRYPKGTVFAAFGYCRQACYMREARDEDFRLAVAQAMAIGEMAILDAKHNALDRSVGTNGEIPGDWRGYDSTLRMVHRMADPADEQRILESRARAKALEMAASPEGREIVRNVVAELWGKRGGLDDPDSSGAE